MPPRITRIILREFSYQLPDTNLHPEGVLTYSPGETHTRTSYALRIETDTGITGEYVGGNSPGISQIDLIAQTLIGELALQRERHWSRFKRILRKYDRMGIGPLDIALWDLAGKYADSPIHELLGTYRERLPAYASTYFGSTTGLAIPSDFADFAATCNDIGYNGFKIHPITDAPPQNVSRDQATIAAVRDRVGTNMDLMFDAVGAYETFADALEVGRTCDANKYYWYEDPYRDAGSSQHSHRKLRGFLETPLVLTELIRGLEPHTDFITSEATDFARADPEWDGGITGAMKIARVAEGLGLDVEFHLAGPAQRHCMAATRNSNYYEIGLVHPGSMRPHGEPPVYSDGYTDRLDAIDTDGTVPVPTGPGLGVSYDWDFIRDNSSSSRIYD